MGPGALFDYLQAIPKHQYPSLSVGFDTSDDACVYLMGWDMALIQTVDFFPPIVDDPFVYGQIAAANALSDVYAMGAAPTLVLNILCVPQCLSSEEIGNILAGGADKVFEAGAVVAGGHSIEDPIPKYGLCVTAICNKDKIWSNAGAQPGDVLVLTKPLGSGIMAHAAKNDIITQDEFLQAQDVMASLNKNARDAAQNVKIHACTDVTGFGFLGHAYEMARASRCSMEIQVTAAHAFEHAVALARDGVVTGGASRNLDYLANRVAFRNVPQEIKHILFDPQTSGGLLFAVPPGELDKLLLELSKLGVPGFVVGKCVPSVKPRLEVRC